MTKINIYNNCPFDSTYTHLTHFTCVSQRDSFLNNYISWSATDFKYIQNYVMVPFGRDYIDGCNYIDFTNKNGFRQFGFVDNLECINEVTTKISFTIDYWMTYMFNTDFGNCYVERGHNFYYNQNLLADNYVNANIIYSENLLNNGGGSNIIFIYLVWLNDEEIFNTSQSDLENCSVVWLPYGMGNGGIYPTSYNGITGVSVDELHTLLSCPLCKKAYVSHYVTYSRGKTIFYQDADNNFIAAYCGCSDGYGKINFNIPKTLPNVRWKKALTYPYSYHKLVCGSGEIILENEFLPNTFQIQLQAICGLTQSLIAYPTNMENVGYSMLSKSLVDNRQHEVSTVKNDLENYLYNYGNSLNSAIKMNTEQKNINSLNNVVSGVQGVTSSVISGNVLGSLSSVTGVLSRELQNTQNSINFYSTEIAKQKDLARSPDTISNIGGGGSICACYENMNKMSMQSWSLDNSNMEKIQKYWDVYGYPLETVVNVKNTFTCMPYYNYIKTNNLLVHVNNQTAKNIISSAFNRGVWIYHNNANYSNFFNQGGDN